MKLSHSHRFIALVLLVTFSAISSGCYKNVAIRPDQIPQLSGMPSPTVVGQSGNTTIYAIPVATVLAPDGTNVQIRGEYNLVLRMNGGQEFTFDHPVRGTIDPGGVLDVNGANRPATRFNLGDIRESFVTQYDAVASVFAIMGASLLAFAVSLGITFAAIGR